MGVVTEVPWLDVEVVALQLLGQGHDLGALLDGRGLVGLDEVVEQAIDVLGRGGHAIFHHVVSVGLVAQELGQFAPQVDQPLADVEVALLALGAERAMIIYRRSEEEMPARIEEVKHAKEEGVEFLTLHNPIEYIADEQGKVKQVVLQKMELGEPDASGRRSPVPIPGATETIDIDLAIVSVGVSPNPIVPSSIKGLELGRKGTIAVNDNMQSSIPTIFAGGDIVRGGATVILAMGDGRKAAAAMNEQLKK